MFQEIFSLAYIHIILQPSLLTADNQLWHVVRRVDIILELVIKLTSNYI